MVSIEAAHESDSIDDGDMLVEQAENYENVNDQENEGFDIAPNGTRVDSVCSSDRSRTLEANTGDFCLIC